MVSAASGWCRAEELGTVLGHWNEEFIHSRGRGIELQHRFPGVLNHPDNILVRRAHGKIVSALALKRFVWETPAQKYNAAMIGLVWTMAPMRGCGHAAANLDFARLRLMEERRDFAVLWTNQPQVYSGRGWIGADCGRYGVLDGHAGSESADPITRSGVEKTEEVRRALAPMRVYRDISVPFPLPLPVNQLGLIIAPGGCAIIGLAQENTYVLDILGTSTSLAHMWPRVSALRKRIHVNVPAHSPADSWLSLTLHADLPPKPLAMWLPLSAQAEGLDYANFYIPFLDRL